jgi:hypothetical protein
MKNTPIHVCAKTSFVEWLSAECRPRNLLSFNHYFRKYFKLVYRKNVVIVTLTISITFLVVTCMHIWVWGILRRWSACAPSAYEVVRNCRQFEKHCSKAKWTVMSTWPEVRKC